MHACTRRGCWLVWFQPFLFTFRISSRFFHLLSFLPFLQKILPSFPFLSFLSSLAFSSRHATPFFHPHISKISFSSSTFRSTNFCMFSEIFPSFLSFLFAFHVSRQCETMRFRPTRAPDPSLCSIGGKRKVVEFSRDRRGGEVGA